MPKDAPVQTLKNHARRVPPFHLFVLPVLIVNAVSTIIHATRQPSYPTILGAFVGVALVLLALYARTFALTVQDRVIRLEMRLRMRELLPPDLVPRIPEFTTAQLVALRFASDAELPALARRVLDERLVDRGAIKKLVKDWQGDFLRA
jgi:hypothetical protein